jgi:O-antigen ligase
MLGGLAATILLATVFASIDALALRLTATTNEGLAGRLSIWRETWPAVRAFWPVGSGAGSFERMMIVYQQRSHLFHVVHADNEYLQILAEGGLLLGIPAALVIAAGAVAAARQLQRDHTAALWIRAGALAGIVALAVQNLVEMTLRVPANALLFAVLAALALHEPRNEKIATEPRDNISTDRRGGGPDATH